MSAPTAFRLANGLTVVHAARPGPVAAIEVWIGAGAADEAPAPSGVAHAVEHMLFRSSRGDGVASAITRRGGNVNAWTSLDHTVVHATVPRAAVGVALAALADAVIHPRLDPDELDRERDVIAAELRQATGQPDRAAAHAAFRQLFLVHPYRRPVIGTAASIAALGSHALETFFRAWYVAANTVVVIVADVATAELAASIGASFGSMPARPVARAARAEPPQRALRAVALPAPLAPATRLAVAVRTEGAADADRAALEVIAAMIERGAVARALVDRGLEAVAAGHHVLRDAGALVIAGAAPARPAAVARALAGALAGLAAVGRVELDRARLGLAADRLRAEKTAPLLARRLGSVAAELDVARLPAATVAASIAAHRVACDARRAALTPAAVRAVVQARLRPDQIAVAAVGGRPPSARMLEAAIRTGLAPRRARGLAPPVGTTATAGARNPRRVAT